jgi:hypothetical protein
MFLGVPHFSSEVFPMSEGSGSVSVLVASLFSLVAPVEYGASFTSDFSLTDSNFWGKEAYIATLGYMGFGN